jgi:hypothetical protein
LSTDFNHKFMNIQYILRDDNVRYMGKY